MNQLLKRSVLYYSLSIALFVNGLAFMNEAYASSNHEINPWKVPSRVEKQKKNLKEHVSTLQERRQIFLKRCQEEGYRYSECKSRFSKTMSGRLLAQNQEMLNRLNARLTHYRDRREDLKQRVTEHERSICELYLEREKEQQAFIAFYRLIENSKKKSAHGVILSNIQDQLKQFDCFL